MKAVTARVRVSNRILGLASTAYLVVRTAGSADIPCVAATAPGGVDLPRLRCATGWIVARNRVVAQYIIPIGVERKPMGPCILCLLLTGSLVSHRMRGGVSLALAVVCTSLEPAYGGGVEGA